MDTSIDISDLVVFLVEPSRMQARLIERQLSELGVSDVQTFHDGVKALAAMRKSAPDLVISALYLGDMSGAQLVEAMRADPLLINTAFVLISSEDNPQYLDAVRQCGASAILTKPFEQSDLRDAIHTTLDFLNQGSLALENDDLCIETLRVLVVDDSYSSRNHLIRILKNIGFTHFTEAENGRQGAQSIDRNMFDLVITDFNMPQMNGDELVSYIRRESCQPMVPVIMISSEKNERNLDAVRSAGVSAILDKPFPPSELRDLIGKILTCGKD